MTSPLATLPALTGLEAAAPLAAANLSVIPLLNPAVRPRDMLTLDEALRGGSAQVTEISESGRVPELRFANDADLPVLLLDGEELVGAKQNRVLNLTVLAPARATLTIPVSCVEAGRWHWASRRFDSAPHTYFAEGRRAKMEDVSASLRMHKTATSDQSRVWADIDAKSMRMKAGSATRAATALYEQNADRLDDFVKAVRPSPTQIGAAFRIDGALVGVEVFGCPRLLSAHLHKLVRSYGLDALDREMSRHHREEPAPAGEAPGSDRAEHDLLAALIAAPHERHKAVGLGEDVRVETPDLIAAALIEGGDLVHLSGFLRDRPRRPSRGF